MPRVSLILGAFTSMTIKQLRKAISQRVENAAEFRFVIGFAAQEMWSPIRFVRTLRLG